MATILVKHAVSLPVSFVQFPGDHEDLQQALESKAGQARMEGTLTASFLRVLGRHWEGSLVQVTPERGDDGVRGGVRAWNKATGLPLMRALADTAYGKALSKEEHDKFAPYYTRMATGLFYGVSPFHPEEERLRTWKEYGEAIAEFKQPEPGWKAILRGIDVIIRKSSGTLYIPSIESCHAASAQMDKVQAQAVVQVLRHALGEDALYEAIDAATQEAQEYAKLSANKITESRDSDADE